MIIFTDLPRNFLGGFDKSPASGHTTHLSSTNLENNSSERICVNIKFSLHLFENSTWLKIQLGIKFNRLKAKSNEIARQI